MTSFLNKPHLIPVRDMVSRYLTIKRSTSEHVFRADDLTVLLRAGCKVEMTFIGTLRADSETSYAELDAALQPLNMFALFRETETEHIIHIITGRLQKPKPMKLWLPIVLFVLTILSVMYTGTTIAIGETSMTNPQLAQSINDNLLPNLWRGLPYALSILLILGGHEMGHYLQMRRYGIASSLPYFIPAFGISPFGTFGAAILLREPMKNRKMLFDVGAAGPLVGFMIAMPILLIGLATSPIIPISGGMVEGNSVIYLLSKLLVFGRVLPDGRVDVIVNQLAWAGWTGLFVTALNLIPLGQLDGGHVLFALVGDYARKFYYPLLGIMIFLTLFVSSAWLLIGVLILLAGRVYAVPLDNITPLDNRRQWLGIATLIIFGLIFVPVPLAEAGVNEGLLGGLLAMVSLQTIKHWLRGYSS